MRATDCVALQQGRSTVRFRLRVKAGGRADRLVGPFDGGLKLEVRAAPERGRANASVIRLIADSLGVSRTGVDIVAGHTSQDKVVEIRGASADEVSRRLEAIGVRAKKMLP